MLTKRLQFATSIVAGINSAYRKHRVVCHFDVPQRCQWVGGFFNVLRQVGIVGHSESYQRGVQPSRKGRAAVRYHRSRGYCRIRVYLRYVRARPVVSVWSVHTHPRSATRVSYRGLQQAAQVSNGLGVVLFTKFGWLPAAECVRRRCGGCVVLGYSVG
jgi:hypothetical protein